MGCLSYHFFHHWHPILLLCRSRAASFLCSSCSRLQVQTVPSARRAAPCPVVTPSRNAGLARRCLQKLSLYFFTDTNCRLAQCGHRSSNTYSSIVGVHCMQLSTNSSIFLETSSPISLLQYLHENSCPQSQRCCPSSNLINPVRLNFQ